MPDTDPQQPIQTASPTVACDGGGGALGHPRVFLNMGDEDQVVCPYCSRAFHLASHTAEQAANP